MTNAELFNKAGELKAVHDAFRDATTSLTEKHWVQRAIDDPYFFVTKSADTALQAELKIGSLVKIMVNLHGEGMYPHYAVVVETPVNDVNSEYVKCDTVMLRFANGSLCKFRVDGRIKDSTFDESKMKIGDIKACDIPEDLLGLVLENCPLKNERACMKETAEKRIKSVK